jgi:hypothetical protein
LILERCAALVLGVYLAGVGIHMAMTGHLEYRNYLHAPASAVAAIAIGVVLMVAGVFMRR